MTALMATEAQVPSTDSFEAEQDAAQRDLLGDPGDDSKAHQLPEPRRVRVRPGERDAAEQPDDAGDDKADDGAAEQARRQSRPARWCVLEAGLRASSRVVTTP